MDKRHGGKIEVTSEALMNLLGLNGLIIDSKYNPDNNTITFSLIGERKHYPRVREGVNLPLLQLVKGDMGSKVYDAYGIEYLHKKDVK